MSELLIDRGADVNLGSKVRAVQRVQACRAGRESEQLEPPPNGRR